MFKNCSYLFSWEKQCCIIVEKFAISFDFVVITYFYSKLYFFLSVNFPYSFEASVFHDSVDGPLTKRVALQK